MASLPPNADQSAQRPMGQVNPIHGAPPPQQGQQQGAIPQQPQAPQPPPKPVAPRDKPIPSNTSTYTSQPEHANIRLSNGKTKRHLSDADWGALSKDLNTGITAAISARGTFEANLREWQDAYDLIMYEQDNPQFDGANIRLPYSATQLESLKAYIAGTVLVPRMYIVTGRTASAVNVSNEIERFYNSELVKMRANGSSYFQRYANAVHLALRDGTCVIEVLWNRTRKRTYVEQDVPVYDKDGNQKFDEDNNPVYEKQRTEVDIYPMDFAECTAVPIKDFLLLPAESDTIEGAAAVARAIWLYESDLNAMVRGGILDAKEVERALNYVESGVSEVASDRQGWWDKDVSQQMDIGLGQGTPTSKFFKNRGPIKVWRIHSRQYDMNGDHQAEENIFYYHPLNQRMLGWQEYDYPVEQRPFFSYTPFPRPDEFYGYSIIERLARVQSEMDIQHNSRINLIIRKNNAPLVIADGIKENLTANRPWYMNSIIEAEYVNGKPGISVLEIPDIPVATFEEESLLHHYGDEYTSLNQPDVGGQSSGKRSATEMRQQSNASGTRMALVCNQLRITLSQVINFVHVLNKTYMRTDPQFVDQTPDGAKSSTLSLDTLSEDVEIGIAGATEPIDSMTRRNETMAFVEKMMAFPFVQSNVSTQWYLARLLCEAFGRVDTTQIIGNVQDVVQASQQQQQMYEQKDQQNQQFVRETGKEPPKPYQALIQGHGPK